MLIVQKIWIALIALSIVMVPASGGIAVSNNPIEMSMSGNADMPCCPCCNDQDSSKNSVTCALKCINLIGAVLPATTVTQPYLVDATPPSFVNDALQGHVSSPPTHPPPV
jgi:hypothetical protein